MFHSEGVDHDFDKTEAENKRERKKSEWFLPAKMGGGLNAKTKTLQLYRKSFQKGGNKKKLL